MLRKPPWGRAMDSEMRFVPREESAGQEERFERLFRRVQQTLMLEWDPIGIAAEPMARDEYDSYAMTVCSRLINSKPSIEEIAVYLTEVEVVQMGLFSDGTAARRTAEALLRIVQDRNLG